MFRRVSMFLIVALLVAPGLQAQEDRGPGPDGPPRGFGPPGGGFGGPGFGPPGGGRRMMGAPGGPLEMLAIREVQSELKLDDEQRKRIEDLAAQTQEKTMAAFREAFEDPDSLDEESREKRVAQVRIETGKLAQETLAKISALLKPEQEERFQQLRLQREGISALVRPEIAKQLELSDEQRSKIEDLEAQQRPFFGPPQRRQQSLDEALAILNDSQKAELAAMKGAEFKFPEPRFGFGGPMGQERELVAKFDKDSDGRLNDEERRAARESIKNEGPRGFGPGGGGPGRGGREVVSASAHQAGRGEKVNRRNQANRRRQ